MGITEYVLPLGLDVRKRHWYETERGRVKRFIVQLEVKVEGKWIPVIRYDCAHGFAHVDWYNINNEKKREKLNLSFSEVLTIADEDIKKNWERYKKRFLQGGWI